MTYETTQQMHDALCAPFPTEFVKWRVGGKGDGGILPLCYVDARAVMERLDNICGMDGWYDEYEKVDGMMLCRLSVLLPNGLWITKSDGAPPSEFEGEKGMVSDALKRAAVKFGLGRYLYDLKVERMPTLDKKELAKIHDRAVEEWGWDKQYRPGVFSYRTMLLMIEHFITDPAMVLDFKKKAEGFTSQMPVKARARIDEMLSKVGSPVVWQHP